MTEYTEFASWYDKMMADVPYDTWADYIASFLHENGEQKVLECGCGTGAITVRLLEKGFDVLAGDISSDMLAVARANLLKHGFRIPVIRQDMNHIEVNRPVDAVVAACDAVNYLKNGPDAFFQGAYNALKGGGHLYFDVSSKYKLSTLLGNGSFSDSGDDWAYICDCSYNERSFIQHMYLTCFVRDKKTDLYRRFSEMHSQRAFSAEELCSAMAAVGFKDIAVYDAFTRQPASISSERIQFSAQK